MSSVDLLESAGRCCSTRVFLGFVYLGGIAMLGSGIHLFIAYKHEADYVDRKNMDFTPLTRRA